MNIVTMCRGGNVRSVAAKQILSRYLKHEVIAIGADNTNNFTKLDMFTWADKIVVMSAQFLPFLKFTVQSSDFDYTHKSILLEVGNDIWGDPFHEDLQLKIVNILNENPEFYEICDGKFIHCSQVIDRIREYKSKIKERNKNDSAI